MRFVLQREPSSNLVNKIAYKVTSTQWHVLDANKGFFTTTLLTKSKNYLSFEIPSMQWMHAEFFEETEAIHFYFQQYNSGYNEHLLTINADYSDAFKIGVTEAFEHYLQAAGT